MAPLCGSCGTVCAASDQRCPACGRVLAVSNAAATALLAGASGHPNGHVIPRSHIIALALFACCAVLTIGAGVWFFAFAPSGSGPHEPPLILTPTPPALAQPAGSPGLLVPTATPYTVPSASATSASQGSGGGGAPTPSATVPGAATATPVASLSPTPTDTPTPTVTPIVSPTPTHTPSSGGG